MGGKAFFVTGTDTEVGKTFIAASLLSIARQRGLRCAGIKPIAAGCERQDGALVNEDALALMAASGAGLDYGTVNPVALEPAIAPHIAAAQAGVKLSAGALAESCRPVLAADYDLVVIEGAGGWFVPLDDRETLADLCIDLNLPVILVVGMKLGCLNHALLTVASVTDAGLKIAGWVANSVAEEMPFLEENVRTLRRRLTAPCLGVVPPLGAVEPQAAAQYLDIEALLG